jgi:hypothetical protein
VIPYLPAPETAHRRALRKPHVRWSRGAALAGAAGAALALASRAEAHVELVPPTVHADTPTTVSFRTPNERPGHATISLVVEAPPGVELAAAAAPPGWRLEVTGGRARWTGGRIEGERAVSFPLVLTARTRAGTEPFRASQTYDDGETVRFTARLGVLPAAGKEAPSQHLDRAFAAGAVGLLVIAASFLFLRVVRQRPLQER